LIANRLGKEKGCSIATLTVRYVERHFCDDDNGTFSTTLVRCALLYATNTTSTSTLEKQ
jgi:hypothetical protein